MRSIKNLSRVMIRNMNVGNCYMINNRFIFHYSGIGKYPITKQDMLTGKGKIVDILDRSVSLTSDPEEKIGIIPIREVNSVQLLSQLDLDKELNNPYYEFNEI